jgi:hypothetical protein
MEGLKIVDMIERIYNLREASLLNKNMNLEKKEV